MITAHPHETHVSRRLAHAAHRMAEPAPTRPPLVTRGLVLAALAATLLVQTQRISPASLALSPGLPWEQDLWRPITCLFYSDGFTVGFAVRLFLLARYSSTLETHAFAHSKLHYLGVVGLGVAVMIGAMLHRPAELAQPYLLTALCFYVAYLAKRLPWEKPPGRHGFWAALLLLAGVSGASAALSQMVGVGAALIVEILDVFPPEEKMSLPPEAVAAAAEEEKAKEKEAAVGKEKKADKTGKTGKADKADKADKAERRAERRQHGLVWFLLAAAALSHSLGLEATPPCAAHQRMYRLQTQLVEAALSLDMSEPAVEEGGALHPPAPCLPPVHTQPHVPKREW